MITLKDACKKILAARPNQYIHCVNEFEKAFAFVMVPEGMTRLEMGGTFYADAVDKEDGAVRKTWMDDELFQGNYKQYSRSEIERLL